MNNNKFIKYQQLARIEGLLIVPLTLAGFIIVHETLSISQSYATRPILQPQIKTIEEIYKSPFPIFTWHESDATIANNFLKQKVFKDGITWSNRVRSDDYLMIGHLYATFNTSVMWVLPLPTAKMRLQLQKRLGLKVGFRIHPTEMFVGFMAYDTIDNYPFIERVNEIVNRVRSAGLFDKWYKDYNTYVIEADGLYYYRKYMKRLKSNGLFKGSEERTEEFTTLMFIACGWCMSTIVFVIEIIGKRCKIQTIFVKKMYSLSTSQ